MMREFTQAPEQFASAMRRLQLVWRQVRFEHKDPIRAKLERQFLEAMNRECAATQTTMEAMAKLMADVRQHVP